MNNLSWKKKTNTLDIVDESGVYRISKVEKEYNLYRWGKLVLTKSLQKECKNEAEKLVNKSYSGNTVAYDCKTGDILIKESKRFFVRDSYPRQVAMVEYGTTKLIIKSYTDMLEFRYA